MKRRTFLKLMGAAAVSTMVPAPMRSFAAEQVGLPPNPLVGELRPMSHGVFAVATENGWRRCDGAWVDRAEYPQLWKIMGVTYGGMTLADGGDGTFRLPDMRGHVVKPR